MVLKSRRAESGSAPSTKRAKVSETAENENEDEISSVNGDSDAGSVEEENSEDEFFETADERRIRLSKEYLNQLGVDKAENEEDANKKLRHDADIKENKHFYNLSDELKWEDEHTFYRGHLGTPTCAAISSDDKSVFTGGKDCAIIKWDVETGVKMIYPGKRKHFDCGGHFADVLGVAVSEDDRWFVSVGADKLVRIWDTRMDPAKANVDKLRGHQKSITGVVIEPGTNKIYTSSLDKSIKVWNMNNRSYEDSLFGHTDGVTSIALAAPGRLVSGGIDKTVRLWKVREDKHLFFSRHTASVDCVTAPVTDKFLSGGQDGSIMSWSCASKRPTCTLPKPHGGGDNWLTAMGCVRNSDVFFSGSSDGVVRIWKTSPGGGKHAVDAEEIGNLEVPGVINELTVSKSGKLVAMAVGKEHKHGRWHNVKSAKNGLALLRLDHSAPASSF